MISTIQARVYITDYFLFPLTKKHEINEELNANTCANFENKLFTFD